jgi:DNA-binding XRE family transcriptional regulator
MEQMSDLQSYIAGRKASDSEFAADYDSGYEDFKFGMLLKTLRQEEGVTQDELARRLHTKKSVVSRIENHSGDVRLSTLVRAAAALGKKVRVAVY